MIHFEMTSSRNPEVGGWDVRLEAHMDLSDSLICDDAMLDAYNKLPEKRGLHYSGVVIATLECMVVHPYFTIFDEEMMDEWMDDNIGVGSIFDIEENLYHTSSGFYSWLERGGDDLLFNKEGDPIECIIMTSLMTADPHVDRGAMLAYMMPHLSGFSGGRTIVVHQEHLEDALPSDQRGRVMERARALGSTAERLGFRVPGFDMGQEAKNLEVASQTNLLGEPEPVPGHLPLFVTSLPAGGMHDLDIWHVADSDMLSVIEISDWAEERLGVRPRLDRDTEPA